MKRSQHRPASDSRSARARPNKDLNFTHASAQKRVRPHVSAADNLCLGCCSVPNVFSVRSCTWWRVLCGCGCLRAAYQVPSSARNAKTLTCSFSSCVIVPSPQISAPSSCHTVCLRVQDVNRHGLCPGIWKSGVPMLGNRLFGLPPEDDTHRQPWDEVVENCRRWATRRWASVRHQS